MTSVLTILIFRPIYRRHFTLFIVTSILLFTLHVKTVKAKETEWMKLIYSTVSLVPPILQWMSTVADSCDGGISMLNHCLSWSKFVNTHIYHSSQWFNIHEHFLQCTHVCRKHSLKLYLTGSWLLWHFMDRSYSMIQQCKPQSPSTIPCNYCLSHHACLKHLVLGARGYPAHYPDPDTDYLVHLYLVKMNGAIHQLHKN